MLKLQEGLVFCNCGNRFVWILMQVKIAKWFFFCLYLLHLQYLSCPKRFMICKGKYNSCGNDEYIYNATQFSFNFKGNSLRNF